MSVSFDTSTVIFKSSIIFSREAETIDTSNIYCNRYAKYWEVIINEILKILCNCNEYFLKKFYELKM